MAEECVVKLNGCDYSARELKSYGMTGMQISIGLIACGVILGFGRISMIGLIGFFLTREVFVIGKNVSEIKTVQLSANDTGVLKAFKKVKEFTLSAIDREKRVGVVTKHTLIVGPIFGRTLEESGLVDELYDRLFPPKKKK